MTPRHQHLTDIHAMLRVEIAISGGDETLLSLMRSAAQTLETAIKHLQWQEEQEEAMARLTASPAVEEPF